MVDSTYSLLCRLLNRLTRDKRRSRQKYCRINHRWCCCQGWATCVRVHSSIEFNPTVKLQHIVINIWRFDNASTPFHVNINTWIIIQIDASTFAASTISLLFSQGNGRKDRDVNLHWATDHGNLLQIFQFFVVIVAFPRSCELGRGDIL